MMRIPVAVAFGVLVACGASAVAQPLPQQMASDVVATVGSTTITLGQVDEIALRQPAENFGILRLSQAIYEARRVAIDELVGNTLLDQEAKAQGVERTALFNREVSSKVTSPTDAEITAWYLANQERVQGATLDQARKPIHAFLIQERTQTARQAYLDRLKVKTSVKLSLESPRQAVKVADVAAALGPANAPVELIEFSDFECPFCLRAHPIVKQVMAAYGDRVRLVYRHYPLQQHPNARPAAEAALCAHDQGKFWPYHDRLFGDQSKLGEAGLKQAAADLGLDTGRFNTCLDSHTHRNVVDADIQAANSAGVTGTPTFFINGRYLSGAPPFEDFKRIIDEELELKKVR
jgi:protein-disulfide isomerase